MRRIKLVVSYDGTNYQGWQRQEGRRSIEGELNRALSMQLPEERPEVVGASRTDSGVHALGNVACFDTASSIPALRFPMALNRYLPEDIRVLSGEEVPEHFHPRFTPHEKHYLYRIDRSRIPLPERRLYCYAFSFPLDLAAMRRAAAYLEGEHDFRSFVNPDSQVFRHGGDAVRTIYAIRIEEESTPGQAGELVFRISGSGFLYHMIRILVGTLLEVGRGRRCPEEMPEILSARDRRAAGQTVPAKGLCLAELRY